MSINPENKMLPFIEYFMEAAVPRNQKAADYEGNIAKKIAKTGWGVSPDNVAGFNPTAADYHVKDKEGGDHALEIKSGHSSMFGQIVVHHHPEKGWHISDKSKAEKPNTSAYMERSGILSRLNHHWGDPAKKAGPHKDVYHDAPNGAEGVNLHYGSDKHVPYIHIKDHGTFHTSNDSAEIGTPQLTGKFRLRARQKHIRTNADGTKKHLAVINFTTTRKDLGVSHLSLDADPA